MNTTHTMVLGSMVLATVYAVLGILVYLLLRRRSPAAGSLAAASTLIVMPLASILALSPWPRWGPVLSLEPLAAVHQPERQVEGIGGESAASMPDRPDSLTSNSTSVPAPSRETPAPPQNARRRSSHSYPPSSATRSIRHKREGRHRWGWRNGLILAILASMALGLARLGSGLWAISRLKGSSQPIEDQVLLDSLDILRAEMSCARSVELRVSSVLATPATIGWRRALILLPSDWPTWDDSERQAVLAHELAHVCRGDFITGLLAQLSLALHFYHPLAHWLSGRLRLEQELAADAWSARLSGGNLPYLMTLARMALRRDDRALTWPARAFLPSRGTFVWRIEMLRDSDRVRHASLGSRTRILTMATLASLAVLIVGLRGPIGPSPVEAQTSPVREGSGGGGVVTVPGEFDLAYLPAETRMLLAIQPSTLLGKPEMRSVRTLLESWQMRPQEFLLPLEEISQLLVFWEGSPANPDRPGTTPLIASPSGFIVRPANAEAWQKAVGKLRSGAKEVQHAGRTYLRPGEAKGGRMSMSIYFPDDRTAIVAHEDLIRLMIEDRNEPTSKHPWDEAWAQVKKGPLTAALETRWLRRRLNQGLAGGPQNPAGTKLDTISPLLEKVRAYAVGINLDRELAVDVVATASSAEDIKSVTDTAAALLTLGRNAIPSLKESARGAGGLTEANEWLVGILASLAEKAQIEAKGQTVHLRTATPLDLAETARIASSLARQARGQTDRVVSVNNLKQIGLAFHNYAANNNHLPPPVLYGGKSGKVPYSWRVALLPYLEQQAALSAPTISTSRGMAPTTASCSTVCRRSTPTPGPAERTRPHTAYFVFTGPRDHSGQGRQAGVHGRHRRNLEHASGCRSQTRDPLDQARGHPV